MAGTRTIRRVLIANRGEIAVRIARTLREMGLSAIGVASDPDLSALHALVCDQVVPLGGTTPLETYLDQEKVLAAARETGADAIHPGYGFLAENASFAKAVEEAGLVWIGPPPESIALMGDKLAAREAAAKRMEKALRSYLMLGLSTSIPFLADVVAHRAFLEGDTCTDFIPKYMKDWTPRADKKAEAALLAALAGPARPVGSGAAGAPGAGPASFDVWQAVGRKGI